MLTAILTSYAITVLILGLIGGLSFGLGMALASRILPIVQMHKYEATYDNLDKDNRE